MTHQEQLFAETGKRPWEMSSVEFANFGVKVITKEFEVNELSSQTRSIVYFNAIDQHIDEVEAALRRGDTVPASVLAEYDWLISK